MKIKELITTIYLFMMSITIICFFIYYRLIFKRVTYSLDLLKYEVGLKYFIFNIIFICLHIFFIFYVIRNFKKKEEEPNFIVKHLKNVMNILIWKPLDHLLTVIAPDIPYSGTLIINYCYFFRKSELRLFFMKMLCFILYFVPRICMSLLFFIEIVFFNRLEIFIKFIWIFIIPVSYMVFLNISEKLYVFNMREIYKIIEVTPTGLPNQNGVYTAHHFKFKPNSGYPENSVEDLKHLAECWDVLFYITNLNAITRIFIGQCAPYITLFTSTLYLMSLLYKLYYLFIL